MLHARHVRRGAALLLPAVLVAVGVGAPTIDAESNVEQGLFPGSGVALLLLLPLMVVLMGIASLAIMLWRKSNRPMSPDQELIAALNAEEWRREFGTRSR